jgi:hypothetical protein
MAAQDGEEELQLLTLQAGATSEGDGGSKKKQRRAKAPRADAYLKGVSDKKLKGQLRHTERLYKEANDTAARVGTWLAPTEAGFIETEGACVRACVRACVYARACVRACVGGTPGERRRHAAATHRHTQAQSTHALQHTKTRAHAYRRRGGDVAGTAAADCARRGAGRGGQGL